MRSKNQLLMLLPIYLILTVGLTVLPRERNVSKVSMRSAQQDDCEKSHPWQHKVNGECVDKPDVHHYHGHHDPGAGETCWIECLCRDDQTPSGNDCGACSFVGTVCIGN